MMPGSHNKAQLPAKPTLKEINWYKKQINWGELPPFYHMVASSVSESEGILDHGFDNAVKRLIDPRNWNLDLLGGHVTEMGEIVCEQNHESHYIKALQIEALNYGLTLMQKMLL